MSAEEMPAQVVVCACGWESRALRDGTTAIERHRAHRRACTAAARKRTRINSANRGDFA